MLRITVFINEKYIKYHIFLLTLDTDFISIDIDLIVNQWCNTWLSTLIRVMACCNHKLSHYLMEAEWCKYMSVN